jgi:hypothetical protein
MSRDKVMHHAQLEARGHGARLEPNPSSGVFAWLTAAAIGVAWLFSRSKPAAEGCPLDNDRLMLWGLERGYAIARFIAVNRAPTLSELRAERQGFSDPRVPVIAITADGKFWRYVNGNPIEAPEARNDYCAFRPGASTTCVVEAKTLDAWAKARDVQALYEPHRETAPTVQDLERTYSISQNHLLRVIVVTRFNVFWKYVGTTPVAAPLAAVDYCKFSRGEAAN